MENNNKILSGPLLLALAIGLCCQVVANGQQQEADIERVAPGNGNFPYYLQSPIVVAEIKYDADRNETPNAIHQRTIEPQQQQQQIGANKQVRVASKPRSQVQTQLPATLTPNVPPPPPPAPISNQPKYAGQQTIASNVVTPSQQQSSNNRANNCLYDRAYFKQFEQCLARKPARTVGLPAYKNDDLFVRRRAAAGNEPHGCSFILHNGMFKHHQVDVRELVTDSVCLDSQIKLDVSYVSSNVSLYQSWMLRCLNYADSLLDQDATFGGKTSDSILYASKSDAESKSTPGDICVGSSQSFGFAMLQMNKIELDFELVQDIYKKWRITNITATLAPSSRGGDNSLDDNWTQHSETQNSDSNSSSATTPNQHHTTSSLIREFVFETLDGDELNWRHMNSYKNWCRNKLHANFLDSYRRFIWITAQNCLDELSKSTPVKVVDLFASHKYV